MVKMAPTLRTIVVPTAGFVALQLHKYLTFSWLMELMLLVVLVMPYINPEKKRVDIGIQTNCDVVDIKRPRSNKMLYASVAVGFAAYVTFVMF
jgi:hypothetical protein